MSISETLRKVVEKTKQRLEKWGCSEWDTPIMCELDEKTLTTWLSHFGHIEGIGDVYVFPKNDARKGSRLNPKEYRHGQMEEWFLLLSVEQDLDEFEAYQIFAEIPVVEGNLYGNLWFETTRYTLAQYEEPCRLCLPYMYTVEEALEHGFTIEQEREIREQYELVGFGQYA